MEKSLALRAFIEAIIWRKSWGKDVKSFTADNPISGFGALTCGTSIGGPMGSKITPDASIYRPANSPMGTRALIEIFTELDNQLRDTSALRTRDMDSMLFEIRRGSMRASFVPVRSPTFLTTEDM